RIWLSTDDGLAALDATTLAVRPLRRAEGVVISAYWGGSGAATPQGEILFGGGGGLTVIRPALAGEWNYRPPVVVTDARVSGQPLAAGRFNGGGTPGPLMVKAEANSLAVEFAALDYSAPERNR